MPFSCFLFHPRKSCEKHRKCSHTNVSNASVIRFSTPPAQTATFAFTSESGYTLGFTQKIAHKGTHGETGGFTFVQSCRAFDRPSSGKRTAGGSGCTPMACVRFLRHRSPAGLRNILFGLPMLYFSRSAHGDFCVCEVKAVSLPSAYSAYCRNSRCPLVKAANSPFPCLARFFFDSSSAKYYPFFFTDTGRTSGQPAGSFAFVCISLTCSDRHDRGT